MPLRRPGGLSLMVPVECETKEDTFGSTLRSGDALEVSVNASALRVNGRSLENGVRADDITVGPLLGQGASGTVHLARHMVTNKRYAAKRFNVHSKERRESFFREVAILFDIRGECLIEFHGAFLEDGRVTVVLEFMDCGALDGVLKACLDRSGTGLRERIVVAIAFQTAVGLRTLHDGARLHRDIKPGNVLLNAKGEVKLADFGIARQLESDSPNAQTVVGTFRYMAPERLRGDIYDAAGDIWSLGIMLLECAAGGSPLQTDESPIEVLQSISENPDFAKEHMAKFSFPEDFADLVCGCLSANAEDRHTSDDLVTHPCVARWLAAGTVSEREAGEAKTDDSSMMRTAQEVMRSFLGTHHCSSASESIDAEAKWDTLPRGVLGSSAKLADLEEEDNDDKCMQGGNYTFDYNALAEMKLGAGDGGDDKK